MGKAARNRKRNAGNPKQHDNKDIRQAQKDSEALENLRTMCRNANKSATARQYLEDRDYHALLATSPDDDTALRGLVTHYRQTLLARRLPVDQQFANHALATHFMTQGRRVFVRNAYKGNASY